MKRGICDEPTFDLIGYRKSGHPSQVGTRECSQLGDHGVSRSRVRIGGHELGFLGSELGLDVGNGIVKSVANRARTYGLFVV